MLNIVPMVPEAMAELVADAQKMWNEGMITETAFLATLVPENTPLV